VVLTPPPVLLGMAKALICEEFVTYRAMQNQCQIAPNIPYPCHSSSSSKFIGDKEDIAFVFS